MPSIVGVLYRIQLLGKIIPADREGFGHVAKLISEALSLIYYMPFFLYIIAEAVRGDNYIP